MAATLLFAALAAFYYVGATEHARVINVSRVRADQSGYLWDAVGVYGGRHGAPAGLIGERNRMPVYPWLLSWLYDPAMTPDQFFLVAKAWNIRLSLVLLVAMWFMVRRYLPSLASFGFILVVGFGYFIFKAGYAQVELLYYTLFFLTFLACCRLIESRGPTETMVAAIVAGTLAALTHLTKAAVLPLVGCVLTAYGGQAIAPLIRRARAGSAAPVRAVVLRVCAGALFVVCFLGVLSPYLVNSKRVFGQYFYNVNTTFYVWYDDWPSAASGTYQHGDGVGWPQMPASEIPTMRSYLRQHSAPDIAVRIGDGIREMATVSYTRLWYFKWVTMYLLFGVVAVATTWTDVAGIIRRHAALAVFLLLYAAAYVPAVAFYKPISGTTLRMLLGHVAPVLFVLSYLFWRTPIRERIWTVAGVQVTVVHFQLLTVATVAFDMAFTLWPRLLADFAGY